MTEGRKDSILAVDFGSVNTRVLLFDVVDGEYALVAQRQGKTSIDAPSDDVRVGMTKILRDLSSATDRRFLDEDGELIKPEQSERIGIDYCITTASAGQPIRVVLIGLLPDKGIGSARRAIVPFYTDAVAEIHLDDGLSDMARLNRIVDSRPDLIFVSGGTDGGARAAMGNMLELAREAIAAIQPGNRPTVLYAGNKDLAASARETLGQLVEVMTAPNIRPTPHREAIEPTQVVLSRFYNEFRRRAGSSYQNIAAVSDTGILPTARGFEMMTAFFARMLDTGVLSVDIGGAKSTLSIALGEGRRSALRTDIGMGQSAANTLELAGEEAIKAWLPFHPRKGELAGYAVKKGLRSVNMPLDMRERYIEFALLRACIQLLLDDANRSGDESESRIALARLGLIVAGGATMAGSGQGALDMMLLSDALPIRGVAQVMSDRHGALPALGALAPTNPSAVVQLLQSGVVEHVGSLIKATGTAALGKVAMKISIKMPSGEIIGREILVGDVWHLPVPAGSSADISLQMGRGVRVGDKRRVRLRLRGGRGGILFDARLSAMSAAESITERAVNMLRWFAAVTGEDQPVMIPESWLATPDADDSFEAT
ncbi:MAG: glutamate mutase L [Chloroflexi bacterium]|nr:glutamate mutase L [Chloroflexota bacterium]